MVTDEQVNECRPENKWGAAVRYGYYGMIAGGVVVGVLAVFFDVWIRRNHPLLSLMLGFGGGITMAMCIWLFRYGPFGRPWDEKQQLNDRIGWQVVWSIDENGDLQRRLELRSHQYAVADWALYQQLGGPRPRAFIARLEEEAPGFARECTGYTITRIDRTWVYVRIWGTRLRYTMHIGTLLRVLRETNGVLGESAITCLLGRLNDSRNENARILLALNQMKDPDKMRQRLHHIEGVLRTAIALAKNRGTRVKDLSNALNEGLQKLEEIT